MHDLNVNIITLRMQHHANVSGYDQLVSYLDADVITTTKNLTLPQRVLVRLFLSKIKSSRSLWYRRANFITEVNAAQKWMISNQQIFHFLYGENSFRYLGKFKSLKPKNYIICTYHTPPSRFKELITDYKFLKLLDAIVVVSTVQYDFFADIVGSERVHFVPHGIDTDYFHPNVKKNKHENLRCISVGGHLRDFQTLANVAKSLKSKEIQFIIVAPDKYRTNFNGMENVDFYSSINDEELLHLYQSADILLLPLLDCTANNALLEGMSCGLPIITTDLPGVKDYITNNCSVLAPKGDSKTLADIIYSLHGNKKELHELSHNSRTHAMNFSWPNVAKKIKTLYEYVSN